MARSLELFLKANKQDKENATLAVEDSFTEPVEVELRPLTSKEMMRIRRKCYYMALVSDGQYTQTVDMENMLLNLAATSMVWPDLSEAKLQDEYGARSPQDLILAMFELSDITSIGNKVIEISGGVSAQTGGISEDTLKEAKN